MNRVIGWMIAFSLMLACHSKVVQNNEEEDHHMGVETENATTARKVFEYFNEHDWIKMAGLYVDTAEFKDPSLGIYPVKQTRQQIIAKYSDLNNVFPDIHDEVIQLYPSGAKYVVVEFVSTGTGPDGKKFELPICSILTIENGLITRDFTYYDNF